ncbi:hypothetical protein IJT17_06465 [bacterium]|nr:hypothetical protein [bacterium]
MFDLEAMLEQGEYDYTLDENGNFVVNLRFDDGRFQRVELKTAAMSIKGRRALHIRSVGCEDVDLLKDSLLRSCLKNSSKHVLGAWELHGAELCFCMKVTAECSDDDLRHFVNYVGVVADEFERKYRGCDVN